MSFVWPSLKDSPEKLLREKTGSKKRRIYLVLAAVAALLVSGAAIYLFTVPIDLTPHRLKIASIIEAKTGLTATAETIVLKALPSPEITLTRVSFMYGDEPIIKMKGARIRFSLIQLIFGNKVIQELDIREPELLIKRGSSGTINAVEFVKLIKPRGVRVRRLTLTEGRINFIDELPGTTQVFDITGVEAGFSDSRQGILEYELHAALESTSFRFKGRGQRFRGRLRLGGEGTLKEVPLDRINPYLRMKGAGPLPKKLTGGTGRAGLDFRTDLVWTSDALSLTLADVKLLMYGFEITGSLEARAAIGRGRKKAIESYEVALKTTHIPLGRFKEIAKAGTRAKALRNRLSEFEPLGGELTITELLIKGGAGERRGEGEGPENTDEGARSVTLSLGLSNLRFEYHGLKETFSGVNGRVLYKDDTLTFESMTGNYGHGVVEALSGTITNVRTTPIYDLSLKAFFEAEKTLGLVKALMKKTRGTVPGRLKLVKASGLTDIELKIKGDLKDLTGTAYSGTLRFKKARFAHPDLPLALRSLEGEIAFDKERITLKDLRCEDEDSALTLNGYVKGYLKKRPWFDIEADGDMARTTLLKFVKGGPLDDLLFDGRPHVKARARGTMDSLEADAYVDFTGTGLKYKGFINKAPGFHMTVDARVDYASKPDGAKVKIKDLALTFGGSKVNIQGEFVPLRPYRATVNSRGIRFVDLDDVSPYFIKRADAAGFIELDLTAVGKTERGDGANGPRGRSYEGRLTVKDGRFSTTLIPVPIDALNAEILLKGQSASLVITDLETGRTKLKGRVDTDAILERKIRFDLDAAMFRLEDLFAKDARPLPEEAFPDELQALKLDVEQARAGARADEERPTPPTPPTPPSPRITGSGTIRITDGTAYGLTFNDLNAEVKIEKDVVYLDPVTFMKNKGPISMNLTIYRDPSNPILFESEIDIGGINLEPFIAELKAKKKILAGDLDGTASLWGKRGAKPFIAALNGEVKLKSDVGKLWKFPILSKVFSIVNILSIDELLKDGLRYKLLQGDFSIKDGVISTDSMVLDSDSLRMSALGEISMPDAYIDGILVMHPFVTIDKIVTNIPLAGWIIGGKKGTTLSMYYEIVGPLKKPYVEPVHARGLQEGIIGILRRLIEDPFGGLVNGKGKEED